MLFTPHMHAVKAGSASTCHIASVSGRLKSRASKRGRAEKRRAAAAAPLAAPWEMATSAAACARSWTLRDPGFQSASGPCHKEGSGLGCQISPGGKAKKLRRRCEGVCPAHAEEGARRHEREARRRFLGRQRGSTGLLSCRPRARATLCARGALR